MNQKNRKLLTQVFETLRNQCEWFISNAFNITWITGKHFLKNSSRVMCWKFELQGS